MRELFRGDYLLVVKELHRPRCNDGNTARRYEFLYGPNEKRQNHHFRFVGET